MLTNDMPGVAKLPHLFRPTPIGKLTAKEPPVISVKLRGTADFAKVQIIKDGQYAHTMEPKSRTVDFSWKDAARPERGKTSYYYVRGEQADGELVWVSPMWVTYE